MRILLELLGAGVFVIIVVQGVGAWISYRERADEALRKAERKEPAADTTTSNKDSVQ